MVNSFYSIEEYEVDRTYPIIFSVVSGFICFEQIAFFPTFLYRDNFIYVVRLKNAVYLTCRYNDITLLAIMNDFGTALIFFVAFLVGAFMRSGSVGTVALACTSLAYAGVMSGAMGYTFQILAQRDAEPTVASLLMSQESVFAALAGWVILGDMLSPRELLGCLLMMGGIVLAQLPENLLLKIAPKSAIIHMGDLSHPRYHAKGE